MEHFRGPEEFELTKYAKGREGVIIGGERFECGCARLGLLCIGLLRIGDDGLSSLFKRHRRIKFAMALATLDERQHTRDEADINTNNTTLWA